MNIYIYFKPICSKQKQNNKNKKHQQSVLKENCTKKTKTHT